MTENILRITEIQRYSVHDGPGIRTVVFFKGCPLRCAWCQNPETQCHDDELGIFPDRCIGCGACIEVCHEKAIEATESGINTDRERCTACGACVRVCHANSRCMYGESIRAGDVLDIAFRDRVFYRNSGGGVTLSGGEPLAQADGAVRLLEQLRSDGIHTAVETCGYGSSDDFSRIINLADCILFDLKLMDPERHMVFTGTDNKLILENLERAANSGVCLIIRVPLIPGVNDDDGNIEQTAQAAARAGAKEVHLLGFHQAGRTKWEALGKPYPCANLKGANPEKLSAAKRIFEAAGLKVSIGGG